MRAYTVHAPPAESNPVRFAFVKDGFSWPALFLQPLWMLWHRLWVTLLGYVAAVLVVAVIAVYGGNAYAVIVAVIAALALGAEGNTIRRLSLEARRWAEVGDAAGRNLEEAELRFFEAWLRLAPAQREGLLTRIAPASARTAGPAPEGEEPILGLFPEPER